MRMQNGEATVEAIRQPKARLRVACILAGAHTARPSACAYIRLILPLTSPELRARLDVRFLNPAEIESFQPDVVIVQRLAVFNEVEIDALVARCNALNARLVYEIDDDLIAIGEDHPEFDIYKAASGAARRLAAAAAEVWVSTDTLAASFNAISNNVAVFENRLDPRVWRAAPLPQLRRGVRILYMGTTSHAADFEVIFMPAYRRLQAELGSRVSVTLIGVTEKALEQNIEAVAVPEGVGTTYPSFASWLQSLPPFDIGVAPLTDTPFNACKSHIKWLEYSALGLATIASSVAEYPQSIKHGTNGLLAGTTAETFYEQLNQAVLNENLRVTVAQGAHRHVISQLTQRAADSRLDRLERLCGVAVGAS